MTPLVKLKERPSRDGKSFAYYLDYTDENGKRARQSLGHADKKKAEKQRAQRERELRMGIVAPGSLKLKDFLKDSLQRTRGQVSEGTLTLYRTAMDRFVEAVGNIDIQKIEHRHGERFIQSCLDRGNAPATVNKNLRAVKRLFELAVLRGQLEQNPLRRVQNPKVPRNPVQIYSDKECEAIIQTSQAFNGKSVNDWGALVIVALCTGMRRGELLNATWSDVDFDQKVIHVSPKQDTETTWEWHIKDHERRTLPLTGQVIDILDRMQAAQLAGCPYIFVPEDRYDRIQCSRRQGKWQIYQGISPVNNFTRVWHRILQSANVRLGEFHDLRRTCLTKWLTNGLSEYDVMHLAGHSDFETTRRFYLAISTDLVQRAREVSLVNLDFGTHLSRAC